MTDNTFNEFQKLTRMVRALARSDKAGWGEGPWLDEADLKYLHHAGLDCVIVRNPDLGNFCAYVGVMQDHVLYNVDYDHVYHVLKTSPVHETLADSVGVHGGFTYSANDLPAHARFDVRGRWWLGWDYGHAFDVCPGINALLQREAPGYTPLPANDRDHYWTLAEVEEQTKQLAEVLASLPPRQQS